ncbi:MAG: hypothetical protein N3D84_02885, partial [Candidatus Woesearchaeota archaeon]|nr:hypothetical protein [Candidatus Woesearchaeota archaeon]
MVPKKDAMYIGNLNELDEALQKSFSAVKRDIEDLNSRLRMLQSSIIDIQKYLTNMQSDYVTIDKLNALKIKLADVNEEIKRLYRLEEAFKLLQERTIEKQKFEMLKKKIDGFDKLQKTAVTEDKLK